MDTDGDTLADGNDPNPKRFDLFISGVYGNVIEFNTGNNYILFGQDIKEFYEQYYTRKISGSREILESMKSSLDLNRQREFTTEEMAFLCNIDPDGVKDYMSTHSIAYKREVFEKFTGKQASDEAIEEFFHVPTSKEAWDRYYMDAAEQMVQGKYTEKSNLLGTMGELGMAFTGMDVVQDLRDLSYDVTHWADNWQDNLANTGEILLGGISLIPVIGIIGKSDELIAVLKKGDNLFELRQIKHLNNLLTELGNTRYMMKAQDLANTAMQKLQTVDPSIYRKILNYCDNSPAYRLAYGTAGSYSNPVVDTLTHYSDDLEEISKVSSGLTREVVEEVAEAGSRNADNLDEVAEEAIESAKKKADEINDGGAGFNVNWTNHGYKHFPDKSITWNQVVKSTKSGPAKYHTSIENIEAFEREAWSTGIPVTNGKNWKVKKYDTIVGASGGKETCYVRIECSADTIHGHPISESEYNKLLK